jgi:hypothetical protein
MTRIASATLAVLAAITALAATSESLANPVRELPIRPMEKPFRVLGLGRLTCGDWVGLRRVTSKGEDPSTTAVISWTQGYLTAYDTFIRPDGDIAGPTNPATLEAWYDTYCASHPMVSFAAATVDLLLALEAQDGQPLRPQP